MATIIYRRFVFIIYDTAQMQYIPDVWSRMLREGNNKLQKSTLTWVIITSKKKGVHMVSLELFVCTILADCSFLSFSHLLKLPKTLPFEFYCPACLFPVEIFVTYLWGEGLQLYSSIVQHMRSLNIIKCLVMVQNRVSPFA